MDALYASIERNGFVMLRGAVPRAEIERVLAMLPQPSGPGLRGLVERCPESLGLLRSSVFADAVSDVIGKRWRIVRSILFDKSACANWSVTPHRDQTIAVRERCEVSGFGPWSMKEGTPHVRPPPELLDAMLTARVH
ncbi:MAG: phytanoyl-CoA dioxygenase, partial [Planctomycetota bacterium]